MTLNLIGRLSKCVLLAYRTPASSVRHLVPRGLELVLRGDWAFWNVVACRVEAMRPAGFPAWCGISYHHVAYRLYVRANGRECPTLTSVPPDLEGLYFVRSDADRRAVVALGNLASEFHFHPAKIELAGRPASVELRVTQTPGDAGDARLKAQTRKDRVLMPGSCFDSIADAEAFLKYRPVGLSVDGRGMKIKLTEVTRDETRWHEQPLEVVEARWAYFESLSQNALTLESAVRVAPIDYRWRLGGAKPLRR